jgi:hypothetical protein
MPPRSGSASRSSVADLEPVRAWYVERLADFPRVWRGERLVRMPECGDRVAVIELGGDEYG